MKWCVLGVLLLQLSWQCSGRAFPEESVVSNYTPTSKKIGGDVYHQIANNIAERITSPIYKFLGIPTNKTEVTPKKVSSSVEFFDEPADVTKPEVKPVGNSLEDRDVEELSVEALKKDTNKKPEKIILYSSYLPAKIEAKNDTVNEIDDPFEFEDDDIEVSKPREGGVVYYLELLGSFFQLALGAILAVFKSSGPGSS